MAKPWSVEAALAANIPERKAERRIREQARTYNHLPKPRIVGAALAANIPEHKAERRIREQARSYNPSSKPRIAGAAIAQGGAGAAKHRTCESGLGRKFPRAPG